MSTTPNEVLSTAGSSVADAVSAIPFDMAGDLLSAVTPDLDDVVDVAMTTVRTGRRLGTRTVRFIIKRPKPVLGVLAAVLAIVAVAAFVKKRSSSAPDLELATAA